MSGDIVLTPFLQLPSSFIFWLSEDAAIPGKDQLLHTKTSMTHVSHLNNISFFTINIVLFVILLCYVTNLQTPYFKKPDTTRTFYRKKKISKNTNHLIINTLLLLFIFSIWTTNFLIAPKEGFDGLFPS